MMARRSSMLPTGPGHAPTDLKDQFGAKVVPQDWTTIPHSLCRMPALIVNTTSLGMQGQPPLAVDLSGTSPATVVTDIVYTPLRTETP
jgi:shikimate dehydrogenase